MKAKLVSQKSLAMTLTGRYCFSKQFDILFAKFGAIFKKLSIILFQLNK